MSKAQESRTYFRRCAEPGPRADRTEASMDLVRRKRVLQFELADAVSERDELRRTMFEAAQMQRRLCGPRRLRRGDFEFASELFPARHVSGDFISLFPCGSELAFAIGDIAGKGLPAAMWFTHLITALREMTIASPDPGSAMKGLNNSVCESAFDVPLTTMFLARLDTGTGRLQWCNAGHPPAQVLRRDGRFELLLDGGPLLGAVPEAQFHCGELYLEPGDTLLAYSDGVEECRNAAGSEFGSERLLDAAKRSLSTSAAHILFSVLAAAQEFTVNQRRDDDMAMIVLTRSQSACAVD